MASESRAWILEAVMILVVVAATNPSRAADGSPTTDVPRDAEPVLMASRESLPPLSRDAAVPQPGRISIEPGPEVSDALLRVLMSRSPEDPDWYPSPFQTESAAVAVSGWLGLESGDEGFRAVYLRVVDPGRAAAYDPASVRDNVGEVELRGLGDTTLVRLPDDVYRLSTDSEGRFQVEAAFIGRGGLPTAAAGDDFFVEASSDPAFNCDGVCARSGVFRLWKRVYLEMDAMYRDGASIVAAAAAGSTRIAVDDVRPFKGARSDRPIEVLLMHAPWVSLESDSKLLEESPEIVNRYTQSNQVVGVVRPDRKSHRGFVDLAHPTEGWFGPERDAPDLRDAIVIPSGGTFDVPSLESVRDTFGRAFVEIVEIENPSPVVPGQLFAVERLGEDFSAYAQKWSDHGVGAQSAHNVVIVVAADHKTQQMRSGAIVRHPAIGSCNVRPARVNSVFLWQGAVEHQVKLYDAGIGIGGRDRVAVMDELVVHELAHAFGVEDCGDCGRLENAEGTGLSTMSVPVGPEMGDGVSGFHLEAYREIRTYVDPLPQGKDADESRLLTAARRE